MAAVLVKKYNPLEMSEEDVLALATGREKLLDIMLSEMKVCLKKGSNQHFVLHGPRGIGKSFFTRLLKIHHDQSDDFKNSLFLQLPEEQENINFAADLLDVISTLLEGGKLIDTAPKWTISDNQWQKSKQRLKEAINDIKKNGKLHVFVTQENLQAFIPKLDKIESSRLREFLSDFDEVTIIGSSLRPDLDSDYSKRLFQVFKKLDIEPWTADDFLTYYDKLAQRSNYDKEQLENLKKSKNKIKAISQFTGGSPRLAVILSKLILEKNILDTAQLLDGIIDELTTYYQDITNDIPSKSKILFDMLIRKGENMTQSTLATSFEPALEQKDIARSFAWLTDNYYVVSSKQSKGNTKYFYVRDRLYVLYYQKRQVYADVDFSYVGVFVDFLNAFYTKREWVKELSNMDLNHAYSKPLLRHLALIRNIEYNEIDDVNLLKEKLILNFQEPKENHKKVTNSDSEKAKIYFDQGNSFYKMGDLDSAISSYKKAVEVNPEHAGTYFNLGTVLSDKGYFKEAILAFEKVLSIEKEDVSTYINLGLVYIKIGEFDKAISLYNIAKILEPQYAPIYYNLGAAFQKKKDYANAFDAYKKAISIEPNDAESYNNLATVYSEIDLFKEAIETLEKAIELNPNYKTAYYNLGLNYRKVEELDKAIWAYSIAIKLDPNNAKYYNNLGIAYKAKNDFINAKLSFKKAITIDPNESVAYNNLGSLDYEQSNFDEALITLEKSVEIDGRNPTAYYNLGNILAKRNDKDKAHENLIKAMVYENDQPYITEIAYSGFTLIIKHQQWEYLSQYYTIWKGENSISTVLGESLNFVTKENQNNKFFYFKNTFDAVRNFAYININEVINGLCIGLYKDGDMDFLRQVVDELSHDFTDDAFVKINLQVYKYLLNPEGMDINQLHPDVRTVVNSIIKEE